MKDDKPKSEPQDIASEPGLFDHLLTKLGAAVEKLENHQNQQTAAQAIPADVPRFVTRR